MASTYMGEIYYPAWLDNLADDVTGEGPAWDGAIQGAAAVHEVVVAAKEIYEFEPLTAEKDKEIFAMRNAAVGRK